MTLSIFISSCNRPPSRFRYPLMLLSLGIVAQGCGTREEPFDRVLASGIIYQATSDAGIQFVYDPAGRLVGVLAPDGGVAQYVYDAAGNITQINTYSFSTLSVLGFSPNQGASGGSITIYGSGFSTTLSNDTVTINGQTCTVTSATATQIVCTLPAGVTTGAIKVKVGSTTKTSNFPLAVAAGSTSITNFTPTTVALDGGLTITGTGFSTTAIDDQVTINDTAAAVVSATATSLTANVSVDTASGKVQVSTPNGTATSTTDLIVEPPSYTLAQLGLHGRLPPDGGGLVLGPGDAGQIELVLFDATAGSSLGISLTSTTFAPTTGQATITVLDPRANQMFSPVVITGDVAIALQPLVLSGTYEMLLAPSSTTQVTGTFGVSSDVAGALVSGVQLPVSLASSQFGRFPFSVNLGNYSLYFSGSTFTATVAATVLSSEGETAGQCSIHNGVATGIDLLALAAGNYTLTLDPQAVGAGQVNVELWADVTGVIPTDGGVVSVSIASGQRADYTFYGNAGDHLGFGISSLATTPSGDPVYFTLTDPSGTQLVSTDPASPTSLDLAALLDAGTYTVRVEPNYWADSATAQMDLVYAKTGTLTSGTPVPFSAPEAGQDARYSFSLTSGVNYSLYFSANTFTNTVIATVLNSSSTPVGSSNIYAGDSDGIDLLSLATGIYTVVLDPQSAGTGQMNVELLTDATGVIPTDGGLVTISLVSGQRADYTFTGTADEYLGFGVSALATTPSGDPVSFKITDPFSNVLVNIAPSAPTSAELSALPDAGIYTVRVEPNYWADSAVTTVELLNAVTATLTSGTATIFDGGEVGQDARYSFTVVAGTNYSLLFGSSTFSTSVSATVLNSAGTVVGSCTIYQSQTTGIDLVGFAAGTYTVVLDPQGSGTGHVTVELLTDVTGVLPIDGGVVSISVVAGQRADYTFYGTVGAYFGFGVPSLTTTPSGDLVTFKISDPVGNILVNSLTSTPTSVDLAALPDAGTYTVRFEPYTWADSASTKVELSTDLTGTLVFDGGSVTFSSKIVGQDGRYAFSGTSATSVKLYISNVSFDGGGSASLNVYEANGTEVSSLSSITTTTTSLSVPNLPVTGTYTAVVDPNQVAIGQVTLWLGY